MGILGWINRKRLESKESQLKEVNDQIDLLKSEFDKFVNDSDERVNDLLKSETNDIVKSNIGFISERVDRESNHYISNVKILLKEKSILMEEIENLKKN